MKPIARMPTKKSYSWWWDSHINSKNSKWLADNLEEMDRCVKEMLELIEGEGDSFAKKADMYYQRRPDLIAHVEDFLRMYRALAERYDNVTGELRKNVPSQLQSQGSGNGSDFGSEPDSPSPESIPDRRPPRPKPGPRPAGFDFFLGCGSNHSREGSKGSSSSESDPDSDDSKHGDGNGNGDSSVLHQRIQELENELHITIEKLHEYEEKHFHDQDEHLENGDHIDCTSKISALEKQLKEADDKILVADEDILNMKQMLEEKKLSSKKDFSSQKGLQKIPGKRQRLLAYLSKKNRVSYKKLVAEEVEQMFEENQVLELEELNALLEVKVSLNKQEIEDLNTALTSVNQQFEADKSCRDEAFEALKTELSSLSQTYLNEKIHLEGIIVNLEGSIRNLKEEKKHFSEENSLLARKDIDRDFLIRELQANAVTSADQYLHEKTHLEGIIANLEGSIGKLKEEIKRISEDGSLLERKHIDQAGLIRDLQASDATSAEQFSKEKCALETRLSGLSLSHDSLESEVVSLVSEITQLRAVSTQQLEELSRSLNTVKLDADRLLTEKEELGAKVNALIIDVKSRDEQINELNEHLHQLHSEHVKLITELETQKEAAGLRSRVRELKEEVDRQRAVIADSAEGKIRLEGIIANLEGSISNLKEEIKHFSEENSLLARKDIDRDFLIRELQANAATSAEQYLHEKTHLEGIIANLKGSIGELKEEIRMISEDGSLLECKHIDQDGLIRELQASAATSAEQFLKERCALEARLSGLSLSHDSLEAEVVLLVSEITQLRTVSTEQLGELSRNLNTVKIDYSTEQLEELSHNLNTVKIDVDRLLTEKEELGAKVNALIIDVKSRDERIYELNEHLHQLHLEHVKLITELEGTRKDSVGLRSRVRELEEEVERQRVMIVDSAEGKREAIRQLCFSLEHYQHGYRRLRRVLQAHKWPAVVAT